MGFEAGARVAVKGTGATTTAIHPIATTRATATAITLRAADAAIAAVDMALSRWLRRIRSQPREPAAAMTACLRRENIVSESDRVVGPGSNGAQPHKAVRP